jgi:hypothetical protein
MPPEILDASTFQRPSPRVVVRSCDGLGVVSEHSRPVLSALTPQHANGIRIQWHRDVAASFRFVAPDPAALAVDVDIGPFQANDMLLAQAGCQ